MAKFTEGKARNVYHLIVTLGEIRNMWKILRSVFTHFLVSENYAIYQVKENPVHVSHGCGPILSCNHIRPVTCCSSLHVYFYTSEQH